MANKVTGSILEVITNPNYVYEGELEHYFNILWTKATNLNNPYHNMRHMLHVTWMCYQACVYYYAVMPSREMRNLLIAALFHDFNHRGIAGDDRHNIRRAVIGMKKWLLEEDRSFQGEIEQTIRDTQWPYKVPTSELFLSSRIIRDADQTQGLGPAWLQEVVFGLASERQVEPEEILAAQVRHFYDPNLIVTRWAKELFPPEAIQAKIDEAKGLAKVLHLPVIRD